MKKASVSCPTINNIGDIMIMVGIDIQNIA
jgi:hypothetical protein